VEAARLSEVEKSLEAAQLSVLGRLVADHLALVLVTQTSRIAAEAPLGVAQFIVAARLSEAVLLFVLEVALLLGVYL